jgi:hypothetical protein
MGRSCRLTATVAWETATDWPAAGAGPEDDGEWPMSVLALQVLAAEEQHRELPAPAEVFGIIALGVLVALLLITLQFNRDR